MNPESRITAQDALNHPFFAIENLNLQKKEKFQQKLNVTIKPIWQTVDFIIPSMNSIYENNLFFRGGGLQY